MRESISSLKSEINKMHLKEGLLRIAIEKQKFSQEQSNVQRRRTFDRKRSKQSLKMRGSKYNDKSSLLAPINEENEDDEEFYNKN
jgi:hypothetical protein